jgi:hypothetical protein
MYVVYGSVTALSNPIRRQLAAALADLIQTELSLSWQRQRTIVATKNNSTGEGASSWRNVQAIGTGARREMAAELDAVDTPHSRRPLQFVNSRVTQKGHLMPRMPAGLFLAGGSIHE